MAKKLHECFFVTPIGTAGSEERKRADTLLAHILRPVSKGFLSITRADEVDEPGTITTDIVKRLHESPLVIADLTGANPNVMYEVGLRHCFNLPIVHIAQDGDKPPFDLAAERIIFFDINDLSSVEEAKQRILSACKKALSARPFRSPVVRALERETLFASLGELPDTGDLAKRLESIENSIERSTEDIHQTVYEAASENSFYAGLPESLENRLDEFLRAFDQIGAPELRYLAQAAKRLAIQERASDKKLK